MGTDVVEIEHWPWYESKPVNSREEAVESYPLLLGWIFVQGFDNIVVQLADDGIEPIPIAADWFEDHSIAMTANANLIRGEPEFLRKSHGLRRAMPKYLSGSH
ncbi:MAG: hypothetical protein WD971_06305 [Pirellulales bacterium]